MDSQRRYPDRRDYSQAKGRKWKSTQKTIHPELLDERGRPINEPLLVMRSVSVEDARQQLDALYNASPNPQQETEEE